MFGLRDRTTFRSRISDKVRPPNLLACASLVISSSFSSQPTTWFCIWISGDDLDYAIPLFVPLFVDDNSFMGITTVASPPDTLFHSICVARHYFSAVFSPAESRREFIRILLLTRVIGPFASFPPCSAKETVVEDEALWL